MSTPKPKRGRKEGGPSRSRSSLSLSSSSSEVSLVTSPTPPSVNISEDGFGDTEDVGEEDSPVSINLYHFFLRP